MILDSSKVSANIEYSLSVEHSQPLHWHKDLELILVLGGTATLYQQGQGITLNARDMILTNAYSLHALQYSQGLILTLHIPVDPTLGSTFYCTPAHNGHLPQYGTLRSHIAEYLFTKLNPYAYSDYYCQSAALLIIHDLFTSFTSGENFQIPNTLSLSYIQKAILYMQNHFTRKLSIREIADQCGITETYLAHLFKETLGITPSQCLSSIRLEQAVSRLIHSNDSIAQIAEDFGFSKAHSFSQLFKQRYQMLPHQYRILHQSKANPINTLQNLWNTKHSEDNAALQPQIINRLLEDLILSQDYSRPADHQPRRINAPTLSMISEYTAIPQGFFKTIHIGHADTLLLNQHQKLLQEIQAETLFTYGYIYGIMSSAVLTCFQHPNRLFMDFSRLDQILNFLHHINLRPYLHIVGNPDMLLAPVRTHFSFCHESDFSTLAQWLKILERMLAHIDQIFGAETVDQWHFAIWDFPQDLTSKEHEQLIELYCEAYQVIRKNHPKACIGSPSIENMLINQPQFLMQIENFLKACIARGCEPDFISIYAYPFIKNDGHTEYFLEQDRDWNRKIYDNFEQLHALASKFNHKPLSLDHWNPSPLENDLLNDTTYKASHSMQLLFNNMHWFARMSYAPLLDAPVPEGTSASDFHGGSGLITQSRLKKPIYHALSMLSKIGTACIHVDENYSITRSQRGWQIYLYNPQLMLNREIREKLLDHQNLFSHFFTTGSRIHPEPQDAQRRYSVLRTEFLEIHIPFTDLPLGKYLQITYTINRTQGSVFEKWLEFGAFPTPDSEGLDYLNQISQPVISRQILNITEDTYLFQKWLAPDEVVFIELLPM